MQSTADTLETPLGVIDSLQRGFDLINHRPWLLIIPLLVDVILWRGPRLSIAPLFERGLNLLLSQPEAASSLNGDIQPLIEGTRTLGQSYNLLSLLAGTITGLPSFLARLDTSAALAPAAPAIPLSDFRQALLYTLLLIPAGLLIGSLWLSFLARSIGKEPGSWGKALRHAGWIWVNAGLYLAGLIAATLAAGGLFAIFGSILLLLIGPVSQIVLLALLFWIAVWVSIGLSFVLSAIALDGVNVARAVWRSVNVVGRNLSSTLGLLVLILVLIEGFARIWLRLSSSDLGLSVGILGNAYLGAALTAATFYFYRARYQHWQRIRMAVADARRQHGDESTAK